MNLKLIVFFLVFTIVFTSCKKENKLEFIDISLSNDSSIVEINIPKALGENDASNSINSAIKTFISSSVHIGDPDNIPVRSVEESISHFEEEFTAFKNVFPDSAQQWEAQIDGEVMYQSPEIISIALTAYVNTGGAHGNLTISFLNFNTSNGRQLAVDDIFSDSENILKIAETYFNEEVDKKNDYIFEDGFILPKNIGYNEDGLIFLYNTYEIAPYSTGITEFTIPYSEVSSYLNYR